MKCCDGFDPGPACFLEKLRQVASAMLAVQEVDDVKPSGHPGGDRVHLGMKIVQPVPGHIGPRDEPLEYGLCRLQPARQVDIAVGRGVHRAAETMGIELTHEEGIARVTAPM